MSTTTVTTAPTAAASTSSLAKSARFANFATAFSLSGTLAYVTCLWFNWPLFTYHPAVNRVDLWWHAARSGEGPAMYWYGWTANVLIVATIIGIVAAILPVSLLKKTPLTLTWLLPILFLPIIIYTLFPLLLHS